MARITPVLATGEAFHEDDLVLKLEMLPEPNIMTDYAANQNNQTTLNFLRRLMEQFIGLVRIRGWQVEHVPDAPGSGTGSLQVSAGEILVKNWYINKSAVTVFDPAPAIGDHFIWLKLYAQRLTFETPVTEPPLFLDGSEETGVAVPSTSLLLPGANQYRGVYEIQLGTSVPGRIQGLGSDGLFVRDDTAANPTWDQENLLGREIECYDVHGNLLGPFTVTAFTNSQIEFEGDATGALTMADALYIKLANIEMSSGIVGDLGVTQAEVENVIQPLPGFVSELLHRQNTDTHTSEPAYYVGGAPGAEASKRVLLEGEIEFEGRTFFQNIVDHDLPDATTRYYSCSPFNDTPALQATEPNSRGVVPIQCEMKFLAVRLDTNVTTGGFVTATLFKNGAPTLITCTVVAGSSFCQDVTNIVEYSPLDTYTWEVENGDGVLDHVVRIGWVIEITADTVAAVTSLTDFEIQNFTVPQIPNNYGGAVIPE